MKILHFLDLGFLKLVMCCISFLTPNKILLLGKKKKETMPVHQIDDKKKHVYSFTCDILIQSLSPVFYYRGRINMQSFSPIFVVLPIGKGEISTQTLVVQYLFTSFFLWFYSLDSCKRKIGKYYSYSKALSSSNICWLYIPLLVHHSPVLIP